MSQFVLDACALLAILKKEPGADKVISVLEAADKGTDSITINKINLLEVYYKVYRIQGKERANHIISEVKKRRLEINQEISDALFKEAGRLKATYKISFADSIALAQALILKAELVTADHHEFDTIEKNEPIRFLWIR